MKRQYLLNEKPVEGRAPSRAQALSIIAAGGLTRVRAKYARAIEPLRRRPKGLFVFVQLWRRRKTGPGPAACGVSDAGGFRERVLTKERSSHTDVAQWVEQRAENPSVAGSTPAIKRLKNLSLTG